MEQNAVVQEVAPADAAEQAQWAQLEKDMGDEAAANDAQDPVTEAKQEQETKAEPPKQERITYEELEKRHKNLNGALAEERALRKQMGERVANMQALYERMQSQTRNDQQPQTPQTPDINEDPIGYFQAKVTALESQLAEKDKAIGQTREQFEAEQQRRQFWGAVQRAENEFKARMPDYDDATTHLEAARIRELEIMFPDDSEQAYAIAQQAGLRTPADLRIATLNQDRTSVARQAFQLGMNPAELYYKLALQRGFQPKGAQAKVTPVQAARAGQAAAKSLSSGSGGTGSNGAMTAEDLADLYMTDPDRADREFARMKSAGLLG